MTSTEYTVDIQRILTLEGPCRRKSHATHNSNARSSRSARPARPPPTNAHSAKALATLNIMETTPSQWKLTPIQWVEEDREVMGLIECPTCRGRKFVRIEDGQVIPPPPPPGSHAYGGDAYHNASQASRDYDIAAHRDAFRANKNYGNCPTCAKRKGGWGMIPQGKIPGLVLARVKVGYPKFPPGTQFDSRFHTGNHCGLCNKLVLRSHRVPVHATGRDGVTHGMFVGEDCAQTVRAWD